MMRLTDDQLFAYLDGGENDPFVTEMLSRDGRAQARLALIRRVRSQLASVAQPPDHGQPTHRGMHFTLNLEPPARKRVRYARLEALRESEGPANRALDETAPLAAFLRGKAERRDLGEVRIPLPFDAGAGRRVLAELCAGRRVVQIGLFQADESPMLWVRIQDRDEKPLAGAHANLLSPGEAVRRFNTDAEGVFELPVPAAPALLRLELKLTYEIHLIPATGL